MDIERAIIDGLRQLPPEKQREVLDYVEHLVQRYNRKPYQRSAKGLWGDPDLSAEDIDEALDRARREVWRRFSRGEGEPPA